MPVEDTIYEEILDEFGFDPDYAVKCIEANRHNNVTATYHLLFKRALREKKPFTNASHVTGSLDRAAIAKYERAEAARNNERMSRRQDWQQRMRQGVGAPKTENVVNYDDPNQAQAAKRGTSTTYNTYKNSYAL